MHCNLSEAIIKTQKIRLHLNRYCIKVCVCVLPNSFQGVVVFYFEIKKNYPYHKRQEG